MDKNRPKKYENVIEEVALYIFTEARRADNTASIQYRCGIGTVQYCIMHYFRI